MISSAETGLFLDGLHCAGCVNRVERALRASRGVLEAAVNYTTHRALVRFDPAVTDAASLVNEVEALGYEATPYSPEALDGPQRREARAALVRLLVAAFFAANVMLVAVALYIGSSQGLDPETRWGLRWLAVVLSLPPVTWCAAPFWRGAWNGLQRREITIDLPIVLGVSAAFATNIAGTLADSAHLYVDSAAMIVFLILLGRTLERAARSRAAGAIERLTSLSPPTARRLRTDGSTEEVEATALQPDDRIVVAPGEVVPADGRVVRGSSEFDESLLSGESVPVVRKVGDAAIGGSLNVLSEIELEVRAAVGAGTLARLAALLERAQTERPHVQRVADRVASVFAPSVIAIALATALGWTFAGASLIEVAMAASAVLIVACPCALGLATPAAITAAIGRAATLGVLVKGGESLERCAAVDVCVLDKTGTLTQGKLDVVAIEPAPGVRESSLLETAARAEGASTHPIASALSRERDRRYGPIDPAALDPWQRKAVAGSGIEATGPSGRVRVGTRSFVEASGARVAFDLEAAAKRLAERGASLAWVGADDRVLGVIGLVDLPRADASDAIARLRALGVRAELVTGDHAGAAHAAARAVAMPPADVHCEVSPEGKVDRVRSRRNEGCCVVAVGDGINDAAALAAADVGVAMSGGSDVSLQASDLVIRAARLGALPDAIELARATLRRIRENLGIAILYNVLAVPLAAAGALPPLWAAVAMSASSLVVTANATRLAGWKPSA